MRSASSTASSASASAAAYEPEKKFRWLLSAASSARENGVLARVQVALGGERAGRRAGRRGAARRALQRQRARPQRPVAGGPRALVHVDCDGQRRQPRPPSRSGGRRRALGGVTAWLSHHLVAVPART